MAGRTAHNISIFALFLASMHDKCVKAATCTRTTDPELWTNTTGQTWCAGCSVQLLCMSFLLQLLFILKTFLPLAMFTNKPLNNIELYLSPLLLHTAVGKKPVPFFVCYGEWLTAKSYTSWLKICRCPQPLFTRPDTDRPSKFLVFVSLMISWPVCCTNLT